MRLFIVALSVLCLVSVVYAAKVKFQGDVEAHLFIPVDVIGRPDQYPEIEAFVRDQFPNYRMKKFPNRPMRIEFRNGNKKVQFNPETVTERDIIDALANNNINVDPELKKLNDEFKAQKKVVMDEFDKTHGIRSIAIQNLKDNGVEEPFSTVDLESEKNAVRAVVLGEVIRASKQAGKIKDEL